ncbi:MAG: ribonuclease HII [Acidobacteria bacterium]|nr:MAG: ribonuclease HII [Acidobacteriota bacterium]PYQ18592.1 MAG: ribonuclease HII [Acidobacteriota bacterium]
MAPDTARGRGRRPLVYQGTELRCSWRFEEEARGEGRQRVAGCDEVGRGALCGPVVAAAVILGDGFDTDGLDDSKRLTERQREALAARIRETARAWAVGCAEPREIDRFNILRATYLAMQRAVAALAEGPDLLLVDALSVPGLVVVQKAIVKGDARSYSIAAASIVAKVVRDAMMRVWDERYPGYGLAHNMGYASEDHREAIRRMGPSEIHRRSFHGTQRWLFC